MIESLRVRWAIILVVIAIAIIWTVPNFVPADKIGWWPTKSKMVLGLDIQGGSHLVLKVDVDQAVKQDATRMAASLPREFNEQKQTNVKGAEVTDAVRGVIRINLNKPEEAKVVSDYMETNYSQVFRVVESTPDHVTIEYAELYLRDFKSKLLDQAIAVIRNRIDEFGVAEPSITAQGTDRVLVQLPGIQDASSAKDLINRTARLDFMMIADDVPAAALNEMIKTAETENKLNLAEMKYSQYIDKLNEALKSKLPPNRIVYFEKPDNAETMAADRIPHVLKLDEVVPGDRLVNAQVSMGERGEPVVSYRFDAVGGRMNSEITSRNIGKPLAIVLDKIVKSTPVIQSKIGDSGQITLGRSTGGQDQTIKEAKILSTALRAGALPASLEQVEERTVGPSLGADAIKQGQIGTLVAALLVFVFMLIYYKGFGLIADLSLALNVLMTFAILSSLGATLTLPGVAGVALTLGIAVDASVIIFERIKEERRKGASLQAAVREGYDRAFSSIFDSNITSIAVAAVIYYFGTGPVRGFAVTLMTGLIITMFTAVFFTRALIDLLVVKLKWNLSIR
ncbi:MAG: protein translocase subunit SecD [Proteobacteria bacterium]|nr:MAG: protein translocase subunit SecD [Pseudomonadota bacterium]